MANKKFQFLRKKEVQGVNELKFGFSFIAPLLIIMLALYVYPIINSFVISFKNSAGDWSGLNNYINLFKNELFRQALVNTLVFTALSVFLHFALGLGFAMLLNLKLNQSFIGLIRGLFMLPWLLATVVGGAIWILLYHPVGIINYYLVKIRIIEYAIGFLGDPKFALSSIILVNVWKFYPLYMIMIYAGLKSIPVELYEAAEIDGAGSFKSFLYITLPSIKGVLLFVTLLNTIWTLRHFDFPFIMTKGGPIRTTLLLSNYIYDVSFKSNQFNYGATITVFLFIISIIFSFFYLKVIIREG